MTPDQLYAYLEAIGSRPEIPLTVQPPSENVRTHRHLSWEIRTYHHFRRDRLPERIDLIAPGTFHHQIPSGEHAGMILHVDRRHFLCVMQGKPIYHRQRTRSPKEADLLLQALNLILRYGKEGLSAAFSNELKRLLTAALVRYIAAAVTPEEPSLEFSSYEKAVNYINDNLDDPDLCVAGVAEHVGCSTQYLAALFRRKGGTTPRGHIIRRRMTVACGFLKTNRYTLDDIARATGFRNRHYFANSFRRCFDMTPGRYAERYGSRHIAVGED